MWPTRRGLCGFVTDFESTTVNAPFKYAYTGKKNLLQNAHPPAPDHILWCLHNKQLPERGLTGHCELLLCLGGSSSPAPLSSSKLRLRLKVPPSRWAPDKRLPGSALYTLLPCSLGARDSSSSRAWLSACRCSITLGRRVC